MSLPEISQSLENFQYIAFKVVRAVIFVGVLWQIVDRHFHVREVIYKWIRLAASTEEIVPRKPSIPSRGT